jgi:hypothetical protein
MGGLKWQLGTSQVVTAPTNAGAYKTSDLVRDTLQLARTGGGFPDLLLMSTNFLSGMSIWAQALQRITNPATGAPFKTALGVDINMWRAPFLGDVFVLEAPLLRPFTVGAFTTSDLALRTMREPFWQPRGFRGDAQEGDWIGDIGVQVEHPTYHAWTEGITAFSN